MTTRTGRLRRPGAVGVPPQRWARAAAWACLACVLPSIGWRVAMLAGVDTGFAEAADFRGDRGLTAYVLALDAAQLLGAVLCVGLAQPWGERWPRWVPGLGGKVIHRLGPTAAGGAAAALLTVLLGGLLISFGGAWTGATDAWTPDRGMSAGQRTVLGLCYAPLFCWPVALGVALVGYWRRREPRGE